MTSRLVLSAVLALSFAASAGVQAQTTSPSSAPSTAAAPATVPPAGPTTAPVAPPVSPAVTGSDNKAVNTSAQNNPGAPVPGANSFTEGQAQSRIGEQGYTQVSDLKLDTQGVWRGTGMKDGKTVEVAMDYQGNVVAK